MKIQYGALEAGGTKMVCAIGNAEGEILNRISIPTKTPEETMPEIIAYFAKQEIAALGIACFGPVDPDPTSPTYGKILATPKLAWRDYDILGTLKEALPVPMALDTDVNGSLLGEVTWGAAKGLSDAIYITVGTGIGGGILSNGKPVHGMLHPEIGQMRLVREPGDTYSCEDKYGADCLEGLACGVAIERRWGEKAHLLADREEVWELESAYLAQAITNLIMTVSPKRIILGGGVMEQKQLFPLIRTKVKEYIGGYLDTEELQHMEDYIVPAGLGGDQGIKGALLLAMESAR